jgi:rhodanese-related sulfurtransferase
MLAPQVMCQHGRARSLAGAALLKSAGFTDVKARERVKRRHRARHRPRPHVCALSVRLRRCCAQILEGGTEAYSQVDPSVPVYPKYTPTFKF